VSLSGYLLGARDEAHKRMVKSLEKNEKLPVELKNQVIFYLGPSPVPPGKSSGSIGPTTSSRMDNLTEPLLKSGVSAAIGKGERSLKTKKLFKKYMAVYFVAPGGVSAYLARKVKKIDQAAYKDLGPEAIFRLEVEDLPLFVAYDIHGGDVFHSAI
jgi:fumarate hydratase subunit beta